MSARPYLVLDTETKAEQRVVASSQAAAIRFVVGDRFKARPMTSMETARAALAGQTIADATAKPQADLPTKE